MSADEQDEYWLEGDGDELACTCCGGIGLQENDDPLWLDVDEVPCECCGGTGLRSHQTIF